MTRLGTEALSASAKLLAPLVRLLITLGISHGEFSAACRSIYVHVAAQELARRHRRVTLSGIAIVTGLTRAEVKRLMLRSNTRTAKLWERQRTARVIQGWRSDSSFLSIRGKPRDLELRGGTKSFAALVKRYSGDIPVRAMLDELVAMGAVARRRKNGKLYLRTGSGNTVAKESIRAIGEKTCALIATLVHNLDRLQARRFEGTVTTSPMDHELASILEDRITSYGQNFLELVEDQLKHPPLRHRRAKRTGGPKTRLSVTAFVHKEQLK